MVKQLINQKLQSQSLLWWWQSHWILLVMNVTHLIALLSPLQPITHDVLLQWELDCTWTENTHHLLLTAENLVWVEQHWNVVAQKNDSRVWSSMQNNGRRKTKVCRDITVYRTPMMRPKGLLPLVPILRLSHSVRSSQCKNIQPLWPRVLKTEPLR